MDSQMVRPHGHTHEQDLYKPQDQHLGGEEEHHEKNSVLKKVKAKAKKIKDTITKHGHGHNEHDHDHIPDDHDLDEEEDDDDDDESLEDPEVHGAPIYDSTKVSGSPTPVNTPLTSFSDHHVASDESVDPSKTFVPKTEPRQVNLERPRGGLLEDPQGPSAKQTPSNYQTKVADPTGKAGEEIGDSPIITSFNKMNINEKVPQQNTQITPGTGTGSHDQFSPDKQTTNTAPTYTAKLSAATSALADKAITAKNAVASKLGYPSSPNPTGTSENKKPEISSATTDKGVSATAYWSEKLKPAEDDRALSEAISGVFSASAAPEKKGRVTESEEVKRRLGDDHSDGSNKRVVEGESEGARVDYSKSGGGGYYAEKIKETVGSMIGSLANTASHQTKPPSTTKSQEEGVGSVGGGGM